MANNLSRPSDGAILGGVAAGIARFLGVEVGIVRIALVILGLMLGSGVLLYLALWALIPRESGGTVAVEALGSIKRWNDNRTRR